MQTQALVAMTGAATMSSREIAELTGKEHRNVLADIRKMLDELGLAAASFSAVAKIAGPNNSIREIEIFNLPKRETLILVSGYNVQMRARIVDRWQQLEAADAPAVQSSPATKLIGELAVLECYTRLLRPSESSKVAMLAHISKNHGLNFNYLPAYVEDTAPDAIGGGSLITKPLTALLKLNGIKFTAHTYNGLLCEAGMLEQRTRKSTSPKVPNGIKRFWAISEKGLRYGKNITNPNSPRETQPHWYESRFTELHEVISQHVRGG